MIIIDTILLLFFVINFDCTCCFENNRSIPCYSLLVLIHTDRNVTVIGKIHVAIHNTDKTDDCELESVSIVVM